MTAERRPIMLSVHRAGTVQFPRYVIGDPYRRVWTGEGWSYRERDGLLHADPDAAYAEVRHLLMLDYTGRTARRFRASVYLDLLSEKPLTKQEIVRWVARVSRLLIDSPEHGNGPVEGALGLVRIGWDEIKEVKK